MIGAVAEAVLIGVLVVLAMVTGARALRGE